MFLALREIYRAKVRFGLLAGAVGLLVFLILFQQALLFGLINQFIGALKHQSGQVLVLNDQARKNLEGSWPPARLSPYSASPAPARPRCSPLPVDCSRRPRAGPSVGLLLTRGTPPGAIHQ